MKLTKTGSRIIHLLDLLCEYLESEIDCYTLQGQLDRSDADSSRRVLRARRIWRSAQSIMRAVRDAEATLNPRYYVFNETDGIPAHPDSMTRD